MSIEKQSNRYRVPYPGVLVTLTAITDFPSVKLDILSSSAKIARFTSTAAANTQVIIDSRHGATKPKR